MSARSVPTRVALAVALAALLMLGILATGCSSGDSATQGEEAVPPPGTGSAWTEDEVQAMIERYAEALSVGFAEQDMAVLESVATVEQAQEEYTLMAALGEGGIVMHAEPGVIELVDVSEAADGSLIVQTREVWDYEHISLETSVSVRSEQGVVYELRYVLVPATGGWVVASIESVTAEGDEPAPSTEDTGS